MNEVLKRVVRQFLKFGRCWGLAWVVLCCSSTTVFGYDLGSVLYIGDSLSMDEFGSFFLRELSQQEGRNYSFYAACGSKPSSWIRQSSRYTTKCGYWEVHSNGTNYRVPWSRNGSTAVSLPFLEEMLESQTYDTLVVQLGLNMLDSEAPERGLSASYVNSTLQRFVAALHSNPSPRPMRCFWIGPHRTTLWSDDMQEQFYRLLIANLQNVCQVIDGRPLTATASIARDGYHLHGRDAKKFALDVFGYLAKLTNSATRQGLEWRVRQNHLSRLKLPEYYEKVL